MARRFRKPKEPKGPMFTEAPEVREIALRLIEKNHTHLAEAKIAYRMRHGAWRQNGRDIYGKAAKVAGINKDLCGFDFVIMINSGFWLYMSPETKEALVDHELSHCGAGIEDASGNPKWIICPHDTEDFCAVIRRHGLWTPALRNLHKANGEHEEQLKMFNVTSLDEARSKKDAGQPMESAGGER